jgi:uncharacterized repeat protein (TIGR01451 family)
MLAALMGAFAAQAGALGLSGQTALEQCRNGVDGNTQCIDTAWQNGNLNGTNTLYREGEAVPYRALFPDLAPGSYTVTIGYDYTKEQSGETKHALDYLTDYRFSEEDADACNDVYGPDCDVLGDDQVLIPEDPAFAPPLPAEISINQADNQYFRIWNAEFGAAPTYVGATPLNPTGTTSRYILVTFIVPAGPARDVVLAWGGHIASQLEWGLGQSASAIPGSPFHMFFDDLTLNGVEISTGSRDRSLSADAVRVPPAIETQVSSSTVTLGSSVTDLATIEGLTGTGNVTGTVGFFVCREDNPLIGCPAGGVPVRTDGALVGAPTPVTLTVSAGADPPTSTATSPPFTATETGRYCFRAEYTAPSNSEYASDTHTNFTTECFTVVNAPTVQVKKFIDGYLAATDADDAFGITVAPTANLASPVVDEDVKHNQTLPVPAQTIAANTSYTVTEESLAGFNGKYTFDDIACAVDGQAITTTQVGETQAYTFQAGYGDNVICTVTNGRNPTIEVTKQVQGGDEDPDGPPFEITIRNGDVTIFGANQPDDGLKDDQSSAVITTDPGDITVSEDNIPAGYDLLNISCRNNGQVIEGLVAEGTAVDFPLAYGDNVTCVVNNTRFAKLIVNKTVLGTDAADAPFKFILDGEVNEQLIGSVLDDNDITRFNGVASDPIILDPDASYTLREDLERMPTGYDFVSVSCELEPGKNDPVRTAALPVDSDNPVVDIGELNPGDIVTCNYVNQLLPTITVSKQVEGGNGDTTPFDLSLTGEPNFQLADNGEKKFTVEPGSFTLTEGAVPNGYAFAGISCTIDDGAPITNGQGTQAATLPLKAGENANCVVTNTKLPTIQVSKTLTGDAAAGDTSPFSFTLNGQAFATLTGGTFSPVTVVPVGAYTLAEGAMPANTPDGFSYAFTGVSCTNNGAAAGAQSGQSVALNLAAGDNVVCVYTNAKIPPAVVTQTPTIGITKAAPKRARGLQRFVYTIRVRNTGTVIARNVVITDPLPAGLTYLRSSRKATIKGRTLTINMGNLQPGASRVVKITVRGNANIRGRRVNVATATADSAPTVRARAVTVFRPLVRRIVPVVTG